VHWEMGLNANIAAANFAFRFMYTNPFGSQVWGAAFWLKRSSTKLNGAFIADRPRTGKTIVTILIVIIRYVLMSNFYDV